MVPRSTAHAALCRLLAATVHRFMTADAKGDQILQTVIAKLASPPDVMNL